MHSSATSEIPNRRHPSVLPIQSAFLASWGIYSLAGLRAILTQYPHTAPCWNCCMRRELTTNPTYTRFGLVSALAWFRHFLAPGLAGLAGSLWPGLASPGWRFGCFPGCTVSLSGLRWRASWDSPGVLRIGPGIGALSLCFLASWRAWLLVMASWRALPGCWPGVPGVPGWPGCSLWLPGFLASWRAWLASWRALAFGYESARPTLSARLRYRRGFGHVYGLRLAGVPAHCEACASCLCACLARYGLACASLARYGKVSAWLVPTS